MKTLEEVKKHLATTAYSEDEWDKIYGFVVGSFPHKELDFNFASSKNFHDFIDWFENEETKKEPEEKSSIRMMSLEELKEIMDEMKSSIDNANKGDKCKNYKYTGLARLTLTNAKSQVLHPCLIEIIDSMLNETTD